MEETKVYCRSPLLITSATGTTFCPGCGHSTMIKILAEIIEENDWGTTAIHVNGVGCGLNIHELLAWDMIQCPHGRAAAVATGVKRVRRKNLVFTYQGDGDASSIGLGETYHAAIRREPITAIMINNQIYGMTGGQTSATTLIGQVTTTDRKGKRADQCGYPLRAAETIAVTEGPAFIGRFGLFSPQEVKKTKAALTKAFKLQLEKGIYSFIEILSMCPTNWYVQPWETPEYIKEKVLPVYPLGVFKDVE